MKSFLTISIFLIFNITLLAQQNFGIKIDGGFSKISDNLYDPVFASQKIYLMPSGYAGFFYNLPIRKHEVFGAELLFTQIEGKEDITDTLGTWPNSNGTTTNLFSTTIISKHISYLSLPITYGINVKNFTFNIGVRISARLMGSAEETIQRNYSFNPNFFGYNLSPSTTYYSTDRLHIKDIDFGETVGIIYHITNMFAIEGNYYYGFNNIFPNKSQTTIWRTQQMTIGFRYKLYTAKQKSTTENK